MPSLHHALLPTALQYLAQHRSVIPLPPGEKLPPLIRWKPYQRRRPTVAEVTRWWTTWPTAGLAIVTGWVSSVVVLDVDPRHGGDGTLATLDLEAPPTVQSGGGGLHFYFDPGERVVPTVQNFYPGIDLIGQGGYITAPPSGHRSGGTYRWLTSGDTFAPLPALVVAELDRRAACRPPQISSVTGLPVSDRDRRHDLTLGDVLARLDGVRKAPRGYFARCPAHDDREPSLSIDVGREGRLLLRCFGRCAFRDVLTAIFHRPRQETRP